MSIQHKTHSSLTKSILFTIALLDYMGFTIGATVFPELFLNHSIGMLSPEITYSTRMELMGFLLAVYPLGQFFSASVFGAASDKWGRKKILLITVAGTMIACFFTALSISKNIIIILFVSRFILGLFAGNVGVVQASIVDISTEETKSSNISLIQLSLGLAWVFGAPIASFLSDSKTIHWFSPSIPFWVLLFALIMVFFMTLIFYRSTEINRNSLRKINPLQGLSLAFESLSHNDYADIFFVWIVFMLGWALFLQFFPTVLVIKYSFTIQTVGPILAFMGGIFAATQIFIARRILKLIIPEKILVVSMIFPAIGVFLILLAKGWWMLHVGGFIFACGMGFTLPCLLAAISNRGSVVEQGKMLGMAQSMLALITIVSTLIGGRLLGMHNTLSLIVSSTLMLLGWLVYISFFKHKFSKARYYT